MKWSVSEELLAQAIGREALKHMEAESLAKRVECDAVGILEEIRQILDDDSLDDPECFYRIEAIVSAFHRHGIPAQRHDFG